MPLPTRQSSTNNNPQVQEQIYFFSYGFISSTGVICLGLKFYKGIIEGENMKISLIFARNQIIKTVSKLSQKVEKNKVSLFFRFELK